MIDIETFNDSYSGGYESFIFQLNPEMNAYYPIAREEKFLYVSHDYFSIGFDESAILLDKNLRGYTNPCKTFNSPKLNNKKG